MKIEDYINQNREGLDIEQPDARLMWGNLNNSLSHQKIRRLSVYLKITAAVVLLMGITLFFQYKRDIPLYEISDALGKKEKAYMNLVRYKMKKTNFKSLEEKSNDRIISFLIEELQLTDTIYKEVIKDMQENGYHEESVEILFDTYEKKIELLEKIFYETQTLNSYDDNEDHIEL